MKILDWKIFSELTGAFAIGMVAALTLLAGDYLLTYNDMLFSSRVPAPVVLQLLLLKLPAYAVMAIPMAVLLALLLALARMSRDSEIAAMRASGLPLMRIMLPCLTFGILASGLSFCFQEYAAPQANARSRQIEIGYFLSRALETVKSDRFVKGPRDTTLRVGELNSGGESHEIQVIREVDEKCDWAVAARGRFNAGELILRDVARFQFAENGELRESMRSDALTFDIGRESKNQLRLTPTPFELDQRELKAQIEHWKQANVSLPQKETELYFKFSLPCASAVFVMLGFPLSIGGVRREALGAVLICAGLVLAYYLLMTTCKGAGYHELLDPRLAAWLPNAILGAAGMVLLQKVARS